MCKQRTQVNGIWQWKNAHSQRNAEQNLRKYDWNGMMNEVRGEISQPYKTAGNITTQPREDIWVAT
jgi:hypothetical protein